MNKPLGIVIWSDEAIHAFRVFRRGESINLLGQGRSECLMPDSLYGEFDSQILIQKTLEAVTQAEIRGSVHWVVPLHWLFTECLSTSGRRFTRQSALFDLEPCLPVTLEDVVCALEPLDSDKALAIAGPKKVLQTLLRGLMVSGLEIDEITADGLLRSNQRDTRAPCATLVRDVRWTRMLLPDLQTGGWVPRILASKMENRDVPLAEMLSCCDIPPDQIEVFDLTADATWVADGKPLQSVERLALHHARLTPVIAFRADAVLGGKAPLRLRQLARHCAALAAMLFLTIAGGLYLQTRSLRQGIDVLADRKLSVYQEVFPVSSLPPGAAMRLASERVRMEALARTNTSRQPQQTVLPPPLYALREIVAALPADLPILLTEAQVDEQQLILRGQTREHRDAERIVEAIDNVPGIKGLAPRTNRLKSGGVEFAIHAGAKHASR